jgi:hypothetical protein
VHSSPAPAATPEAITGLEEELCIEPLDDGSERFAIASLPANA